MVRKTITPDILKRMKDLRSAGATYAQICSTLGVTKERCVAYLKNVPTDSLQNALTAEWQTAEKEAITILEKMGFSHIVNLNEICNINPYWDYYCEKGIERWLIDVTINGQKSIAVKQDSCVEGYNHAILFKNTTQWKLIILRAEVNQTIPIDM